MESSTLNLQRGIFNVEFSLRVDELFATLEGDEGEQINELLNAMADPAMAFFI